MFQLTVGEVVVLFDAYKRYNHVSVPWQGRQSRKVAGYNIP